MCGTCEQKMGKAGMALGGLSTLLALVCRVAHVAPMEIGARSFAAGAVLMFLMAIAANTTHAHETPH